MVALCATDARREPVSDDVKRATAVLQSGDATVYILGISHVSKESCRHIRELIAYVEPDSVLVELCKDRTGLLLDQDLPPQRWHSTQVVLTGYSEKELGKEGWPTQKELISTLKSSVNASVSIGDIEDDVVSLLSTGLFRSVRPITRPPAPTDAPSFSLLPSGKLTPIAPLGAIEFTVAERRLPLVADFKIEYTSGTDFLSEEVVQKAQKAALDANVPALHALLRARAILHAAAGDGYTVAFSGVDTGKVTAHIAPVGTVRVVTGLESSASNGQGFGIDMFQRQGRREEVKTAGFNIMLDDNTQVTTSGSKDAPPAARTSSAPRKQNGTVKIEPWGSKDVTVQSQAPSHSGIADTFAALLTQKYAFYQAEAGRKVGLSPGEAWRVSLEAAAASGASKIFLGDRPADVTGRRLAQGMWGSSAPFLFGALPAAAVSALLASETLQGSPAAAGAPIVAAILPIFLALYPILSPLLEVQKFSKMTPTAIEEAVSVKEPVQRPDGSPAPPMVLWGEDALLKWPGAMPSIIQERDEYMARALAAIVTSKSNGLTPAFVHTVDHGDQSIFRYAMPRDADPGVCPVGAGAGRFDVKDGAKRVVAVVGTAHVTGIMAAWQRVSGPGGNVALKEFL